MRIGSRVRSLALAIAGLAALGASPERGDPVSRISGAPHASEYWDFVASFDTGEHLFARFFISNEGPGPAKSVAIGHFLRADGPTVKFSNAGIPGRWSLDAEGRALHIHSSRLDMSGPEIAFDIDNDKRGIKIHLRMRREARSTRGPELPGTSVDVLALAAPVEGTVWFTGMSAPKAVHGSAGISHTWMDERESELVARRIDFFGRDAGLAVYLGSALAPDGRRAQVVTVERDGSLITNVTQITVSLGDEETRDLGPDYPIPSSLTWSGSGISGGIHIGRMLLQHEPLQDLPLPFRFLLSWDAHLQRVWMDSRFEVRVDRSPSSTSLQAQGSGITSLTFTNPLPSATLKRHASD